MANKLATHLWFDTQAEDAANYYVKMLGDGSVDSVSHYPTEVEGMPGGSVMQVELTLMGQKFIFLNGGPLFPFNSQVSIFVRCENQAEVDKYWDAFVADGGKEVQCGWLEDKFGLSWQIIPRQLEELVGGPDREKATRATEAMLKMKKIDVAELQRAYDGT